MEPSSQHRAHRKHAGFRRQKLGAGRAGDREANPADAAMVLTTKYQQSAGSPVPATRATTGEHQLLDTERA